MLLFCAPILASNERKNEEKMSVVIHALLFAWYVAGNFCTFFKHRGFGDFPITIGTCFVTSITVNTKQNSKSVFTVSPAMTRLSFESQSSITKHVVEEPGLIRIVNITLFVALQQR
jgi:hypothetical protein